MLKIWNYFFITAFCLVFVPFGHAHGDINVANGDDVADCFPVSRNFPLFTTKNHRNICVGFSNRLFLLTMQNQNTWLREYIYYFQNTSFSI